MRRSIFASLCGLVFLSVCGTAKAQGPVPGQPYQIPPGYEVYAPGTIVNYLGIDYVLLADGTMVLNAMPPAPPPIETLPYVQPDPTYVGAGQPTYMPYFVPPGQFPHHHPHHPDAWGWGHSPNQMGTFGYQPVNYHGHQGYLVNGSMNGHPYTGLFNTPPHHGHHP